MLGHSFETDCQKLWPHRHVTRSKQTRGSLPTLAFRRFWQPDGVAEDDGRPVRRLTGGGRRVRMARDYRPIALGLRLHLKFPVQARGALRLGFTFCQRHDLHAPPCSGCGAHFRGHARE